MIFDPSGEPPDGCVLLSQDTDGKNLAAMLASETGLRVITSSGPIQTIALSLLAEPKMPLVICAIAARSLEALASLPALSKSQPRPAGVLLIEPDLSKSIDPFQNQHRPPISIFASKQNHGASLLAKAVRKSGSRVHLELFSGAPADHLSPTDQLSITMNLSALARGIWPH